MAAVFSTTMTFFLASVLFPVLKQRGIFSVPVSEKRMWKHMDLISQVVLKSDITCSKRVHVFPLTRVVCIMGASGHIPIPSKRG